MMKTFLALLTTSALLSGTASLATPQTNSAPTHTSVSTQHSHTHLHTTRFIFPSTSHTIVRTYDPPAKQWQAGHRGVDIAMNESEPVYASGDGRVIYAGILVDRNVISIEHTDTLRTTYEPVTPAVRTGDTVTQGQIIGYIEKGGHCGDITCLHWGAKYGKKSYINPLSLLESAPIRLIR